MTNTSKKYNLNTTDLKKIGVGALMAIIGALLTFLTETLGEIDLGQWTPIIVSGWSVFANLIRKFISDYSS